MKSIYPGNYPKSPWSLLCLLPFLFSLISLVFIACVSPAGPAASAAVRTAAAPASLGPDELDAAVREASDYLNGRIPPGSKVAFINISGGFPDAADYILGDLTKYGVNDGIFSVVDRASLDQVRNELNFNMSGEVSDKSAQEIGKMLGAQTIVSGSVRKIASMYRLEVKAIEVQTASVQGQWNKNIPNGFTIAALTENTSSPSPAVQAAASSGRTAQTPAAPEQAAVAAPTAQAYKIGETGPAGGLIFYDKGNRTGGWRYLEAAPANTEKRAKLLVKYVNISLMSSAGPAADRMDISKTSEEPGRGKENTEYLIERVTHLGFWDTAAQYCDDLTINGFDDWYLPSIKELSFIYGNLVRKEMGDFRESTYWSSTGWNSGSGTQTGYGGLTWNMQTGQSVGKGERAIVEEHYVRAVRRF